MKKLFLLLACITPFPSLQAKQVEPLDKLVDQAIARYDLPGLAVGVVKDGKIVYTRVHGERRIGTGEAIDADTLFKIASNSKAMTGALLARLVDQGKLAWEDPVTKYLPDFAMHDPWVTQNMQVRDLLIHNSGLGVGAGDLMLWPEPNHFTREDVIHGLRYLKPAYSFRSRYAYDNTLYIVAGEVAAKAGGAPYDVLLRQEIFAPLKMDRCQIGAWNRDEVGNVAQPHAWRAGRATVVGEDEVLVPDVPMAAAGAVRCSLADMLRWTQMWLNKDAMPTGADWLSDTQRAEVWKNHQIMPLSSRMREWDNSHYSAYGLGWRLSDVDGTWKVAHTGTLSGMYSALTLLPEKGIGFVVLINAEAEDARTTLVQALVKHYTAPGKGLDVDHYDRLIKADRAARPAQARKPDTTARSLASAAALGEALGQYRDAWFGNVRLCATSEGRGRFVSERSPLLRGDVYRFEQRYLVDWDSDEVDAESWLDVEKHAGAYRLKMRAIDPDADFSYDYQDLDLALVSNCEGWEGNQ